MAVIFWVIIFWASLFLIFYTYAGYPIALIILTRFRPAAKPYPEFLPTVTLLIAAHNEEKVIKGKLENSLALDYPREKLQILIVDDGSTDKTAEIIQSFSDRGIELCRSNARNGKMAAIDYAMSLARGEILVLSDANNHYNPAAIKALVAPFQDPTVGVTGGFKYVMEDDGALGASESTYGKYESWVKRLENQLGCVTSATGEANALRRQLYVRPPHDTINDDFYLMMQVLRQGYRMVYVPAAVSTERVSASESDEIERRTRIVAGRYQAIARSTQMLPFKSPLWIWQVVSHKYLRLLLPFLMITTLISTTMLVTLSSQNEPALLWLSTPWNWIFLVLQIIFYIAAWLGAHVGNKGRVGKILYLATFLVNSNFAALRGFWRYFGQGQTTQWKRVQRRGEN